MKFADDNDQWQCSPLGNKFCFMQIVLFVLFLQHGRLEKPISCLPAVYRRDLESGASKKISAYLNASFFLRLNFY